MLIHGMVPKACYQRLNLWPESFFSGDRTFPGSHWWLITLIQLKDNLDFSTRPFNPDPYPKISIYINPLNRLASGITDGPAASLCLQYLALSRLVIPSAWHGWKGCQLPFLWIQWGLVWRESPTRTQNKVLDCICALHGVAVGRINWDRNGIFDLPLYDERQISELLQNLGVVVPNQQPNRVVAFLKLRLPGVDIANRKQLFVGVIDHCHLSFHHAVVHVPAERTTMQHSLIECRARVLNGLLL